MNPQEKSIRLSVAVVTCNRPESLEMTLKSLSLQQPAPFEVVVSDDSNKEDAIAQNQALAKSFGYRYVTGPRKGLYANRNFAARNCLGTHIRTMDDDHEFPEGHFARCLEAVMEDDSCIWTIGEYNPHHVERPLPASVPGQLHPRGFSYEPGNMDTYYGISCGASIYPRAVVDQNVLNSEAYKFGILYLEYGARLQMHGFRMKFIKTTYVIHHHDEKARSVSAPDILNGSTVFAMFMFSFYERPTLGNKMTSLLEMARQVISGRYSLQLVKQAYRAYKEERKSTEANRKLHFAGR